MDRPRFAAKWTSIHRYLLPAALAITSGFGFAWTVSPARAHRIESALTTIEHNPRTGKLEIIHEIYHHDLEHVWGRSKGRAVDLTNDKKDLREAVDWLAEDFALADAENRPLALRRVGAEFDRDRLLIYYEITRPEGLDLLKIFDQMLMDSIPQQVNRVNTRIDGPTRTLVFRLGDGWKELPLQPPSSE